MLHARAFLTMFLAALPVVEVSRVPSSPLSLLGRDQNHCQEIR